MQTAPRTLTIVAVALFAFAPSLARADDAAKPAAAAAPTAATPAPTAAATAAPTLPAAAIWSGASAGFSISWGNSELVARDARGAQVFSAKALADKDFDDFDNCDASDVFAVLSVVGSLISIKQQENASCAQAAHTSAYASIIAVDLARPEKAPSLADYFSEEEMHAALLADGVVQKTLKAAGKPAPDKVAALLALLADNSSDCAFRFEPASLTHFAFHHLEKNKVALRIGLPYGCEAARGNLTQLGLLLTVPAKLKDALAAAGAKKQGFLMKDAKAIVGTRTAEFDVKSVPPPQ